ncbi:MAG TPA: MBL fold metallo-hydrolase [Candidatus Limnocylindrales bacterium]|nr:MBL fold metallo-hydrolase [Candidatus Limnocylindrales bacterium]
MTYEALYRVTDRAGPWIELGDRVFTRRYRFFQQQIGVVLGDGEALVIDTRSTGPQAEEILADVRELTSDPVTTVVNSHWHYDHSFGNHTFRPTTIWGHERCRSRLEASGEAARADVAARIDEIADDIATVVIDPPDHAFAETARIHVGGRPLWLRYLGRGHTDTDIVVEVPDAGVLFAGDLVEHGAPPSFSDSYPLDWPETVARLLDLVHGPVVPGHGPVGDRGFVESQLAAFLELTRLGRDVNAGRMTLEAGVAANAASAFGEAGAEPLERTLAQLRGELD